MRIFNIVISRYKPRKSSYKGNEITTDYLIKALKDMHFGRREIELDLLYYAATDLEQTQ